MYAAVFSQSHIGFNSKLIEYIKCSENNFNVPVVEAGGEFSRDLAGSESMSDPSGVPESDSIEGVGDPTDILTLHR